MFKVLSPCVIPYINLVQYSFTSDQLVESNCGVLVKCQTTSLYTLICSGNKNPQNNMTCSALA